MPYCVGVGNGLDALTLSLKACSVSDGDEVIVPAHTFFATWLAVTRCGAQPVPVDADHNTFNIDTEKIGERITPRTRVIIPAHLYGQPCDMSRLMDIAEKNSLHLVEDNAQAQGARWLQQRTGGFGVVNATSFYPTKNLGALGDGGAVTVFDPQKADFVRRNRHYGMDQRDIFPERGLNSRLDEIQAAVLRIKLAKLDEWNLQRRAIADRYLKNLSGTGDLILPLSEKEAFHVYHLFVVRTDSRDRLKHYLAKDGISTMIHYPVPPHLQPAFSELGYKRGAFPEAEAISETALSLPLWPGMSFDQVDRISERIADFFA
jgi:dTDP-4-amino-4,6-dideoxygalactose transaminase